MVLRKPLSAAAAANVDPNIAEGLDSINRPPDAAPALAELNTYRRTSGQMDGHDSRQRSLEDLPESLRPGSGRRSMEGSQSGEDDIAETTHAGPPGYTPSSSGEFQRPVESHNPYIRRQQSGGNTPIRNGGGSSSAPAPPSHAPPPPPVPKDSPPVGNFAALSLADHDPNPWANHLDTKPLPDHPYYRNPSPQDLSSVWSDTPPQQQAPIAPQPTFEVTSPTSVGSPQWDEALPEAVELISTGGGVALQEAFSPVTAISEPLPPQETGITENAPAMPPRPTEEPPALPPRQSQEQAPAMPPRPAGPAANTEEAGWRPKSETYEIKKVAWYDATSATNPRVSPILVQNANGPCPLLALVNALSLSTPANITTALVDTLRSREQISLGLLLDAVFDELMSGRRKDPSHDLPDVSDLYQFLISLHTGMNVNPRFVPPSASASSSDPRNSMDHVHPSEREDTIPGTFEETREMKLYSTFSVPLVHGWLPRRDSPAYTALRRSAPTYEDAQNIMFMEEELQDKFQREGLSREEQTILEDIFFIKAFFREYSTQLTPHGLETITRSMAPGSIAILFRNDHFSTLYRHPESRQLMHLVTDMGYAGHEEIVWESLVDVNGENCEFFSGDFRIVGDSPPESRAAENNDGEWETVPSRRGNNRNSQIAGQGQSRNSAAGAMPTSPTRNTEQEDHDLALALQLQDEEEARHAAEQERRRREAQLSEQFIEQQASQRPSPMVPISTSGHSPNIRGGGRGRGRGAAASSTSLDARPNIPPRRSGAAAAIVTPVAAHVPVHDPEAGVDVPPPSYEQAATQEAYIPPVNHPAHPSARIGSIGSMGSPSSPTSPTRVSAMHAGVQPQMGRRQSAYSATSAAFMGVDGGVPVVGTTQGGRRGHRQHSLGQVPSGRRQTVVQQERERDCVIM